MQDFGVSSMMTIYFSGKISNAVAYFRQMSGIYLICRGQRTGSAQTFPSPGFKVSLRGPDAASARRVEVSARTAFARPGFNRPSPKAGMDLLHGEQRRHSPHCSKLALIMTSNVGLSQSLSLSQNFHGTGVSPAGNTSTDAAAANGKSTWCLNLYAACFFRGLRA